MTNKTILFDDWLEQQLEDPELRDAVEDREIAYQITRLRLIKGLTQTQLAQLVGTKQSSIARLESGKTMPRLSFLRKVIRALGGTINFEILTEEEAIDKKRNSTMLNIYFPVVMTNTKGATDEFHHPQRDIVESGVISGKVLHD